MRHWTDEEDQFIRSNYEKMTDTEMAQALAGRTHWAVKHRRQRLGLYVGRGAGLWTSEEKQFIRDHYEEMTDSQIAAALPGRTEDAVQNQRHRSGLHKCEEPGQMNAMPEGKGAMKRLFRKYRTRARDRDQAWELSIDQFEFLTSQPCHYCGVEPRQVHSPATYNGSYTYNGIDRVDSNRGYVIGNVVPCCGQCNIAKNDHSLDEFVDWVIRLHDHLMERT